MTVTIRRERGSFTVEAALALPVFMFAFIAIMSLALVAKAQGQTQYALDQTAKEIARYCYIADRANLLLNPSDGSTAAVNNIDEAVGAIYSFTDGIKNLGEDVSALCSIDFLLQGQDGD